MLLHNLIPLIALSLGYIYADSIPTIIDTSLEPTFGQSDTPLLNNAPFSLDLSTQRPPDPAAFLSDTYTFQAMNYREPYVQRQRIQASLTSWTKHILQKV